MNTRRTRLTLLGLAFGVLLALLLAPQTRWLVRAQIFPEMLLPSRLELTKTVFVRRHPNDFQVQLAGNPSDTTQTPLDYARSLVPRFPDSASLRAEILRDAMSRDVRLHRDEDNLLEGKPVVVFHPGPNDSISTPAALAAFDADAASGERLDPDNAYFPFMRSVGLLAAHRDTEALAAVQRASTKHIWREYCEDEVEGRWRINDAVYGGREALSAGAVSAAVLFPHYQQLRETARIVEYKAILEEHAGQQESGLAKREALARLGEVMGVQSTTFIGNLVGMAINMISRNRPGGAPPLKLDSSLSGSDRVKKNLDDYCAYVVKIGHPEAAVEARADYQAWQQIHRVTSRDAGDYIFGIGLAAFTRLGIALAAGWAILPNVASMFVLGLVAAGLSRLPRVQARRSLPAGAVTGFWVLVFAALAFGAVFVTADPGDFPRLETLVILTPLVLAGLLAALLPRFRRPIGVALLTAGITAGIFGLVAALIVWQGQSGASIAETLRDTLSLSGSDPESGALSPSQTGLLETLLLLAFTLALPLLTAALLSIVSRVKRVPVSAGLVFGFRAVMPPLICALMLVYGGLTLWTIRQEARANYGLERSLHGEGQYLAQMTGEAWPEPAR